MKFSRFLAAVTRGFGALTLAAIPIIADVASAQDTTTVSSIFRPFPDDSGQIQSARALLSLNRQNKFFDPALGNNDQACVTCHQPDQGFTLNVESIQDAFTSSNGGDPLFRVNDTADRPDAADPSAPDTFRLFLDFGIIRIGKTLPTGADFTVEPQDTPRFGPLPNSNDPQAPGRMTLSLFRRPVVNTNVHFDSAVLWDGRASVTNMRAQVKNAAKGLLLAGDVSDADADDVAAFMLNVFTDQISDTDAGRIGAGRLSALGAKGGVANLLALASDPAAPCLPLTMPNCTPVIPENPHTVTIFDAWSDLPGPARSPGPVSGPQHEQAGDGRNVGRASVSRGQELFNTVTLHVPADVQIPGLSGDVAHCITCHASNNIGNHPDPAFFVRLGTDSVDILKALEAQDSRVHDLVLRVTELPEYCLRPTSDPTPFASAACGTHAGDVKTTDPGRALVTGKIADVGKFKPPILRGLTARSPYFHAGLADGIDALVDFYDARFQIGLTDEQHADLVAFVESY